MIGMVKVLRCPVVVSSWESLLIFTWYASGRARFTGAGNVRDYPDAPDSVTSVVIPRVSAKESYGPSERAVLVAL